MDSVKFKFAPEFLNRLDEILFFSKLGKSHVSKIVEIQLNHLKKRLISNNFFIEWDNKVNDTIALLGYDPEYGARPIKRKRRHVVEDEISRLIINNAVKEGDTSLVSAKENIIQVNVK
jgi:ATP-dependent Clp protease ATP-binding subunit ClpB